MTTKSSESFLFLAVAHRGANKEAPENTAPAIIRAKELGVDGVEVDIRLSKDGVPFLWHDNDLARLGLGKTRAEDLFWEELKNLDAGSWFSADFAHTRILSLKALLELCGNMNLYLELKSAKGAKKEQSKNAQALAKAVLSVLKTQPKALLKKIHFLSFEPQLLQALGKKSPYPRFLNVDKLPKKEEQESLAPFLTGYSLNLKYLKKEELEPLREQGFSFLAWVANGSLLLNRAKEAGIQVIMSDRAQWLVLERQKKAK